MPLSATPIETPRVLTKVESYQVYQVTRDNTANLGVCLLTTIKMSSMRLLKKILMISSITQFRYDL